MTTDAVIATLLLLADVFRQMLHERSLAMLAWMLLARRYQAQGSRPLTYGNIGLVALRGWVPGSGFLEQGISDIANFGEEALLLPGTAMLTVASQTPVAAWSAPGLPKVVWPWLDSRQPVFFCCQAPA